MIISRTRNTFTIEDVTDPEEIAATQQRRAQFDRNVEWLKAHADAVYEANRGRHICIAGQEVFAADDPLEAMRLAKAAHPTDEGCFLSYIPAEKMPRIFTLKGAGGRQSEGPFSSLHDVHCRTAFDVPRGSNSRAV
jgi:hypothetical protein